jgi:hypothetical protein
MAVVVLGAHGAQLVRVWLLGRWLTRALQRLRYPLPVPVFLGADRHEIIILRLLEIRVIAHVIFTGATGASFVQHRHTVAALSLLVRAHPLHDVLRVVPLHILVVDLHLRNFLVCALIRGVSACLALALIRENLCLDVLIVAQRGDAGLARHLGQIVFVIVDRLPRIELVPVLILVVVVVDECSSEVPLLVRG